MLDFTRKIEVISQGSMFYLNLSWSALEMFENCYMAFCGLRDQMKQESPLKTPKKVFFVQTNSRMVELDNCS